MTTASAAPGKVIAGAALSLDGYMAGPNGDLSRLYPDMSALHETEMLQESIRTTGAVVMGRRTFAMDQGDDWADHYEYQVPLFVLTHHPPARPPRQNDRLTFTFITDGIESAIRQARAAAGSQNVTMVGGASTIQQCLNAGLVDELDLLLRPVLLGGGLRLFEHLGPEPIELEQTQMSTTPVGTHLVFRVLKGARAGAPGS